MIAPARIAVLTLLAALVIAPGGAHAATLRIADGSGAPAVTAASDPIRDAAVNLYCRLRTGRVTLISSGSGVFISSRGVILTNAHVAQYFLLAERGGLIKGSCMVRTGSPAKEAYEARILYFPPSWIEENSGEIAEQTPRGSGIYDFALLYVTASENGVPPAAFPFLPVGTLAPSEGSPVTIAGYPSEDLRLSDLRHRLSQVVASSTVTDVRSFGDRQADVLALAPSTAGAPGTSGGPVVDERGFVVGIAATRGGNDNDRSLRAITLSYIDRAVLAKTLLPFSALLASDFPSRAYLTKTQLPEKALGNLSNNLRKKG